MYDMGSEKTFGTEGGEVEAGDSIRRKTKT